MGIFKLGGAIAKRRVVLFSVLLIIVGVGLLPQVLSADEDASNGGINAHNRPVIVFNGPAAGAVNADDGKTINAAITTVSSGHTIQNTRYKKIDDVDECSQTHTDLDTQTERQAMGQAYTSGTDVTFTENGKMLCIYAENRFGSGTGFYYSLRESNPVSGLDSDPPTLTLVDDSNLEIHEGAVFSKTLARFKFRSSETGSITGHTGACGAATSTSPGDASTNLPANTDVIVVYASLADGLYDTCEMTVEDDVGHEATLSIPSFTIDTVAPEDLAVAFSNVLQSGPGPAIFNADVTSGTHPVYPTFTGYGASITGSITQGTFTIGGETYTIRLLLRNSADQKLTLVIRDSGDNTVNIREVFAGHTLRFVDEAGTRTFSANDAVSDTDGWVLYQGADATLDTIFADGNTFAFSIESGGTHYLNSAGASNPNDLATVTSDDSSATYTYKVVQSSVTCDENVSYEATIPGGDDVPAAEGDYNLCVKAADAAENTAYAGAQFTKDITAPDNIAAAFAGALNDDDYINAEESNYETDIISNVRSDDSTATYAFAIVSDPDNTNCSSATYTAEIPQADEVTGSDGDYKVCIKATDLAGNLEYGEVGNFEKDIIFNAPTKALALTGENTVDNADYLNAGDPQDPDDTADTITFTVTVDEDIREDYTTVTLELDNTEPRHTFDLDKNDKTLTGTYTIASPDTKSYSSPLIYGGTITDQAGNTLEIFGTGASPLDISELNANTQIRIDTTPPLPIVISRLAEASDSCADLDGDSACDYGTKDDNITNVTTPSFEVTGVEAHATVTVTAFNGSGDSVPKTHAREATPSASYNINTLPEDDYDVSMTQTDRAENTSAQSNSITGVLIDTTAPPTTVGTDLQAGSDTGVSDEDNYTNAEILIFDVTNRGEDDLLTALTKDGTMLFGEPLARSTSAPIATLTHNTGGTGDGTAPIFGTTLYDKAGNTADSTNTETVYLDYSVATPDFTRNEDLDSGASNTDGITNNTKFGFRLDEIETAQRYIVNGGSVYKGNGAKVVVYDDSNPGDPSQGKAVPLVSEIGHDDEEVPYAIEWIATDKDDFAEGRHGFYACQTDDAGNQACSTEAVVWIVDTTAPVAPEKPDLHNNDDSYGRNANDARDGTNTDNLTNRQYELDFASQASGSNISAACINSSCAHDQHQIRFYKQNDSPPSTLYTATITVEGDAEHGYDFSLGHQGSASSTDFVKDGTAYTLVTMYLNLLNNFDYLHIGIEDTNGNYIEDENEVILAGYNFVFSKGSHTVTLSARDHHYHEGFILEGQNISIQDFAVLRDDIFGSRDGQFTFSIQSEELTQPAQPEGDDEYNPDNVRGASDITEITDAAYLYNSRRGTARELYPSSDGDDETNEELAEGTHTFVAHQYDIAGNLSPASAPFTMTVDITPPPSVTTTLVLHKLSDTGSSDVDKETSNVSPAFHFVGGSRAADDIDYYEIRRARMTDRFTTPSDITEYTYPSNPDTAQQTSYEYPPNAATETVITRTPETHDTYGEGAYRNGALVQIASMDVPIYNSWYAFKVFTIDEAGNYTPGSDSESVRILVPPPTPTIMDLDAADDSHRDEFTEGNADNITNETVWTLSGSYKNVTTAEKTNDAAAGVQDVRIEIVQLDENSQKIETQTHTFTTATDGNNTNNITPPADVDTTGADDPYTYSFTFDASVFSNLTDGVYSITATALNSAGEEGVTSEPLSITLDRTAPVPEEHLKIRTFDGRYTAYDDETPFSVTKQRLYLTNPSGNEPNAAMVVHTDHLYSRASPAIVGIEKLGNDVEYSGLAVDKVKDFPHHVEYVDAAGNSSGRAPLREESKPPIVTSYVTNEAENKYLIIATPREGGSALSSAPAKQYPATLSPTTNENTDCPPPFFTNENTKTSFTLSTIQTITTETCIEVTDSNGNIASRRVHSDKNDLIANAEVHDEDDTGRDRDDNITNITNPRYIATTIPGSTVRLQTKLSGEAWTDTTVYEQTLTADRETGALTAPGVRNDDSQTTATIEVRGYVTNTLLGSDEVGPIPLASITIDTTAPNKPTGLDLAAGDDTGKSSTDNITATARNLSVTINGEENAIIALADESTARDLVIIRPSHIYESAQLSYALPPGNATVQLTQDTGKPLGGHPDDLLWERQASGVITFERDSAWFTPEQRIKWFALEIHTDDDGRVDEWVPFYWIAPNYTLPEYIKDFRRVSEPTYESFETSTNSIELLFEEPFGNMSGVFYKTKVDDSKHIQWGIWSTESTEEKIIYGVSFKGYTSGSSVIEISPILMTEFGVYEGTSTGEVTIPHAITGTPYNLLTAGSGGVFAGTISSGSAVIDLDLPEEKSYNLTATAEDVAGNVSEPSDPLTVTVDTEEPAITIIRLNDSDTTIDESTRFIVVASDATETRFSPASGADTTCTASPVSFDEDEIYTSPEIYDHATFSRGTPETEGICFVAQDAAGNESALHTDNAIEGVGDLQITGGIKVGDTYHTRSGRREVTGITASGAKVFIKIVDPIVTKDLQVNDVDEEVRRLQVFLNSNGYLIANSGPESPGNETDTFTEQTKRSVQTFQLVSGLTVTGIVNEATRNVLYRYAAEAADGVVFDTESTETAFTRDLSLGSGDTGKILVGWIWTTSIDETTATPAVTLGTLAVDNTRPRVTETTIAAAADKPQQKQGDIITATFRADEIIQTADLTIAGQTAQCTTIPTTNPTDIVTCTVTLGQDSEEGKAAFRGAITDRAGNETTINTSSDIQVDARAPTVTIEKTERQLFTAEESIDLTLTLTDRNSINAGTHTFSVSSTASLDPCSIEILGTTTKTKKTDCTVTINSSATDGQEITLTIPQTQDQAGNTNPTHTVSLGHIDLSAPTLSAITQQAGAKKKLTFTIEAVHNQHTSNANLPETLTPVFSGDCSKFKASPSWTSATPADNETQTYTASASATKGTYNTCTLTLTDEAGNTSEPLTFDEFSVRGGGGFGRLGGAARKVTSSFFSLFSGTDTTAGAPQLQPQPIPILQPIPIPQLRTPQTQHVYTFTRNLTISSTGEDVRQLQVFLNNNGYTVANTGTGSPGFESAYFGELTRAALARYQAANGISPAVGYFGPITRAHINSAQTSGTGSIGTGSNGNDGNNGDSGDDNDGNGNDGNNDKSGEQFTIPTSIPQTYRLGDFHNSIKAAQILLNRTSCKVATIGAGSPGNETAYFGNLTETALKCFQRTQSLTQDGILTPTLYQTLRSIAQGGTIGNSNGNTGNNTNGGDRNSNDDNYSPILGPIQIQRPTADTDTSTL